MKAELYGVRDNRSRWSWRITLDYEVDHSCGFGLFGAATGVIRFSPELGIGQALYLAAKLNSTCKSGVQSNRVRRELIIGCREIGISSALQSRITMSFNPIIHNQASTSSRAPLNNRVLDQLIRILAGRSLLVEELTGIMQSSGMAPWVEDWRQYVQAGVCSGQLQLAGGMSMTVRTRWLGGKQITAACQRCGTQGVRELDSVSQSKTNTHSRIRRTGAGDEAAMNWSVCRECGCICPYCEECATMGRIRHCSLLIRGLAECGRIPDEPNQDKLAFSMTHPDKLNLTHWGLSPAQEAAAREGLHFLAETARRDNKPVPNKAAVSDPVSKKTQGGLSWLGKLFHVSERDASPPEFLIWAVTGAGKTEMIFPFMEYELRCGKQVLLATPRRDVVLELKPRLEKAFPDYRVVALYGGSEDRWERGDITLATTHQLMRFHRAFDLVIIDELDAFPYHNNPALAFAAQQVCTSEGRYVYLSATPPLRLQRATEKGRLPHVKVPVRYHRNPLPVPVRLAGPGLSRMIKQGKLAGSLLKALSVSVKREAQVFVFVPRISWIEPLIKLLKQAFPLAIVEGTSSKDESRGTKVTDFRGKKIDLLVTTTILERGVTVPKTDVFIIDADAGLFDEASLVQMAGRAGRSKDDPFGYVYFSSREWTRSQAGAIKQITAMNRLAAKNGYLLGAGQPGKTWKIRRTGKTKQKKPT